MIETPPLPQTARRRSVNGFVSVVAELWRKARQHPAETVCVCILFLMGANLVSLAWRQSLTNDEVVHIPSGYRNLTRGDFRLNPEHPPLTKIWSTLPLLIVQPNAGVVPPEGDRNFGQFTADYSASFWQANRTRFRRIIFLSRLPMVLLTLALGVLIFVWGRQLFGPRAAVMSVALFSLEPTMLAHGHIVHTDIAAAFGYLLFLFALHAYYRSATFSRAVWFGVVTGCALLTKFSMVILIPVFFAALVYVVVKSPGLATARRKLVLHAAVAVIVLIGTINLAYYFQHPRLTSAKADWISATATTPDQSGRIIGAVKLLSRAVPTNFLFGLYTIVIHNRVGHPASLLGDYRNSGWWYYFPVAFGLKTTLPFLLLSVAALCWAVWAGVFRRERVVIALLLAWAVYMAFAMSSSINIGVRHIAPTFPILFLLCGAFLDRLMKSRARIATTLVLALVGLMLFDAVRTYPDYMSFTNALTLGKPNWQVLSDSNVDWGENMDDLARYLHDHGETKFVGALSAGWATPQLYGIEFSDAPADIKASPTRYVALGAGFLNGSTVPGGLKDSAGMIISEEQRHNYFSRYRDITPEAVFGNSIYLYRAR